MSAGTTLSFAKTANFNVANAITIAGDPVFTPPAGTAQTLSGVISDGGSPGILDMQGPGTLVLSGANTYTGGTAVSAGTLQLSGSGTLGAATATLGVSGGTLDLGATTQTTGALTLTGGTIQNGTLQSSSFGVQAGSVSAVLGGGGALTKSGPGIVVLSGNNTYTGGTNVNGGALVVNGAIVGTTAVNNSGMLAGEPLPPEIASAYASVFKASPAKAPVKAMRFEPYWSEWGSAYGGANRTDGDPAAVGSHDLTTHTGGFAAGADYRVSPFTTLGFALAGAGTSWSLAQNLGSGSSDAFQAGIYGRTTSGPLYVAASFAFAEHWMSTSRTAPAFDQLTARSGY
jgi:autotransporter-associated beta strand protein